MDRLHLTKRQFKELLDNTIQVLKDQFYDNQSESNEVVASILKRIDFFSKILDPLVLIQDFIEEAKPYFSHEVHSYGTVLIEEKEYNEKFFLLLSGSAHQICQRSSEEIEQALKLQNVKSLKEKEEGSLSHVDEGDFKNTFYLPSRITTEGDLGNGRVLRSKNSIKLLDLSTSILRRGCLKYESEYLVEDLTFSRNKSEESKVYSLKDFNHTPNLSSTFIKLGNQTKKLLHKRAQTQVLDESYGFNQVKHQGENQEKDETDEDENLMSGFEDMMEDKDFANLLQKTAMINPKMKDKLLLGKIPLVSKGQDYKPGDYFGESFSLHHQCKETSSVVVSSEEAHFMIMTRESYRNIINELYKRANKKIQLFTNMLPNFSGEIITKFSHHFVQKSFKKGEIIYSHGTPAQGLYLLLNGIVKLFKKIETIPNENSNKIALIGGRTQKKIEVPIVSIAQGHFFGEEFLFGTAMRQYSAISNSSDTIVYVLDTVTYEKIKERFKAPLDFLKEQAHQRIAWREHRALNLTNQQSLPLRVLPSLSNLNPSSPNTKGLFTETKSPHEASKSKFTDKNEPGSNKFIEEKGRSNNHFLKLYKENFSRRVAVSPEVEEDHISFSSKNEKPNKVKKSTYSKETLNLFEFNVRKELEVKKTFRIKPKRFSSLPDLDEKTELRGGLPARKFIEKSRNPFESVNKNLPNDSGSRKTTLPTSSFLNYYTPNLKLKKQIKIKKMNTLSVSRKDFNDYGL